MQAQEGDSGVLKAGYGNSFIIQCVGDVEGGRFPYRSGPCHLQKALAFVWIKVPMKQQESAFTASSQPFTGEQALTVGQLNRMAGRLLQDTFGTVRVVGELSNFTRAASGHWYFTLKETGLNQIGRASCRERV